MIISFGSRGLATVFVVVKTASGSGGKSQNDFSISVQLGLWAKNTFASISDVVAVSLAMFRTSRDGEIFSSYSGNGEISKTEISDEFLSI